MKKNDFERIEKQLSPDDKLIQSVMEKAEMFSAEPEKAQEYLKEHDISEKPAIKHTGRYTVIAAAAALVLVFGVTAFIKSSDNSIKTDRTAVSKADNMIEAVSKAESKAESISSADEISSVSEKESTAPVENKATSEAEQKEEKNEEISKADNSTSELEPETVDDGRAEWFPDAGNDYPVTAEEGDGYQQAVVLELPIDEYIDLELDGVNYHFACGDYGEIWEFYIGSSNIPNSSYIGEYITTVDAASLYGDIRPNTQAEIYSLKYADSGFMVAAKFPNFNNDQRYYLFANTEKYYGSFSELIYALNMDKYTFNGQAINVYDGMTKYVDDDSELTQLFLSADGELTDTAYGEVQWTTYLDAPMYGASVNFTCYSEGYIAVNVFGNTAVYNVGTAVTDSITSYINNNSHE